MGVKTGVKTPQRRAIELLVVGVAYYAAARVGLLMQLPGTNASAAWPPSGIGLAAVLALGFDIWPAITIAAFLANLLTLPASPAGVTAALLIALGNTVEPLVALSVIRRFCPSLDPFRRAQDAVAFVAASLFSGFITATCGAAALAVFDLTPANLYGYGWVTRWVADVGGMVILAPALYAWYRRPRLEMPPARAWELAALLGIAALIGELVFGGRVSSQLASSRPYLPLLLWAAFRFGHRETSTLAAMVSAQAVAHTWLAMQEPSSASASVLGMLFVNVTTAPADWLRAVQLFLCGTAIVAGVVAAAVAERDESARAMTDSERRFRTIFEQAAVGVALIRTTSGEFARVNERYCEIAGLTEAGMTAAALDAMTHPDDRPAESEYMRRLVAGEITQFTMEKRFQRKDGSTVWVNLTASPTWKPGDSPTDYVAIVKDITRQKQADRLFRATVESAPTAMIMTTLEGEIMIVNEEAESLFGYPRSELVGRPFDTLVPYRFREVHPVSPMRFGDSPKKHRLGIDQDFYCRRSDGGEFPVELGVSPVTTEQGTFILTAVVDMTARKELETGLLGVNHALEGWVRERTWQLESANRNLEGQITERQRIETELRSALQEKETLLREIHHRVKNNLAVVSGLLYLESTHVKDAQAVRMLEESQHRVRSMAMVHEKLYASGNLAAVNAREYFESLLDYLLQSYSTRSRQVSVAARIDEASLDVETAVPCGLIFTELVTNSLKHAFPDGRSGSIAVEMSTGTGGHQVLTVRDDGVGLPLGLNIMHAPSLGWRLVRSLSRQLGAGLEVRDGRPGTETVLQFQTKVAS